MAKRRARGEGTIYQREDGLWVGQITLPDGNRPVKYSKKQKEVKDWLLLMRKNIQDGTLANDKTTVAHFLERYLNDVACHTLRPKTIQSYRYLIESHIIPEIGHLKIASLTTAHVQRLCAKKLESGLSKRTVQYIRAVLHRALNYGVRWNVVVRNVATFADTPPPSKTEIKPLTVGQVHKLLEVARIHRWYPLYVTAIYMGLREGEVLGLQVEDFDFNNHILLPNTAVQYIPGVPLGLTDLKTESSCQPLPVPEFAMKIIKEHLHNTGITSGLLFRTRSGKPISPRNLLRHFKTLLKTAGLPDVRFHDLRHTTASLLIAAGCHPKEIQAVMRHSKWGTTMDIYGHLMPGAKSEAARRLNDLLDDGVA